MPETATTLRTGRSLWLGSLVVALLAVAVLGLFAPVFEPDRLHVHGYFVDQVGYVTTARHLAEYGWLQNGLVYPAYANQPDWRPYMPGYYVVLATSYWAFGWGVVQSLLPSLLAYVLCVVGVYMAGSRLYGTRTGQVAALLLALFPPFIHYAFTAMAELTFAAAGILTLLGILVAPRRARPFVVPLLLVLPFLVRETGALLVIPLLCLCFNERPRRPAGLAFAALGSVALLGAVDLWQTSLGKGGLPLSWVVDGLANYTDATHVSRPLAWTEFGGAVVANARRNAAMLMELAAEGPIETGIPWLIVLTAASATLLFCGASRWRRDALPLGAGLLALAVAALAIGLYDVKGQKLLRTSLFVAPWVCLGCAALLPVERLGERLGRTRGSLALAVLGGVLLLGSWNESRRMAGPFLYGDDQYDVSKSIIRPMKMGTDRILMVDFGLRGIMYANAMERFPARSSYMAANRATLQQMLESGLDVGMVVLSPAASLTEDDLRELGFENVGEFRVEQRVYPTYKRPRPASR